MHVHDLVRRVLGLVEAEPELLRHRGEVGAATLAVDPRAGGIDVEQFAGQRQRRPGTGGRRVDGDAGLLGAERERGDGVEFARRGGLQRVVAEAELRVAEAGQVDDGLDRQRHRRRRGREAGDPQPAPVGQPDQRDRDVGHRGERPLDVDRARHADHGVDGPAHLRSVRRPVDRVDAIGRDVGEVLRVGDHLVGGGRRRRGDEPANGGQDRGDAAGCAVESRARHRAASLAEHPGRSHRGADRRLFAATRGKGVRRPLRADPASRSRPVAAAPSTARRPRRGGQRT